MQTTQNVSSTIRSFNFSSGIFKILQLQCKQTITDSEQQTCSDLKTLKENIRKGSEIKITGL